MREAKQIKSRRILMADGQYQRFDSTAKEAKHHGDIECAKLFVNKLKAAKMMTEAEADGHFKRFLEDITERAGVEHLKEKRNDQS